MPDRLRSATALEQPSLKASDNHNEFRREANFAWTFPWLGGDPQIS
jgi:hypothetical protein